MSQCVSQRKATRCSFARTADGRSDTEKKVPLTDLDLTEAMEFTGAGLVFLSELPLRRLSLEGGCWCDMPNSLAVTLQKGSANLESQFWLLVFGGGRRGNHRQMIG